MTKDAADDPYRPQHRRFVLPCSECGETERVALLLHAEHHNLPLKPLCSDCADIELRVWGRERVSVLTVPGQDVLVDEESGERLYVVTCPRCNGTGMTAYGWCYGCIGARWVSQDDKGVRRTARWWQTYQQNRTP